MLHKSSARRPWQRQLASRALGSCLAALVTVGCGNDSAKSGPPVTTAPLLRGSVELTIGREDDEAYRFQRVTGLAVDSAERIIVADGSANVIKVFAPTGELGYAFGQKGEGPGDLAAPCCLAIDDSGRLWVQETDNGRYSVFRLDPRKAIYAFSIRMPMPTSKSEMARVAPGADESVTQNVTVPVVSDQWQWVRATVGRDGALLRQDTLPQPPADSLGDYNYVTSNNGVTSKTVYSQPYGPVALRAFGPNGETADAVSSRYAVTWFDAARRPIVLVKREVTGPSLSAGERASAQKTIDAIAGTIGKAPFGVPDRKAPLDALGFDLGGRLWVKLTAPAGGPPQADVYDRRGTWLSTMEWPANIRFPHWTIRDSVGVGILTDSLGFEQVVWVRFKPSSLTQLNQ